MYLNDLKVEIFPFYNTYYYFETHGDFQHIVDDSVLWFQYKSCKKVAIKCECIYDLFCCLTYSFFVKVNLFGANKLRVCHMRNTNNETHTKQNMCSKVTSSIFFNKILEFLFQLLLFWCIVSENVVND